MRLLMNGAVSMALGRCGAPCVGRRPSRGPFALAAGALDMLREDMANSLSAEALVSDAVREGIFSTLMNAFGWKSEDGHCNSTAVTWLLLLRGLAALVEEDSDTSRAALQEWLPPPAELLRIAEHECFWPAESFGANHPALLCARLHGERLGEWAVVVVTAKALLRIEHFNPVLRTEAFRLLARAQAELGRRKAACEAHERAIAEAARARAKAQPPLGAAEAGGPF